MKILTSDFIKTECKLDYTIIKAPVFLSPKTGNAMEMGCFYDNDLNKIKSHIKQLSENNDIYIYDGWDGEGCDEDFLNEIKDSYILRFTYETK